MAVTSCRFVTRRAKDSPSSCDKRIVETKQLPMASMRCEVFKICLHQTSPTSLIISERPGILNGSVFWAGVLEIFFTCKTVGKV